MDTGASGIGASYQAYLPLAHELGLDSQLVLATPYIGIFRQGRIHLLHLDHLIWSGLTTRLLSVGAKLKVWRLVVDLIRASRRGQLNFTDLERAAPLDTETAQCYALRDLNPELEAYLCSPIVRTMLIAETSEISKVELFSGLANIFSSRVYALLGGLAQFPQALAARLDVALRTKVTRVAERGDKVVVESTDSTVDGSSGTARFDACVIACPLPVAARICPDRSALLNPINGGLSYTQAITVAVGTRIPPRTPAFLVQMPAIEDEDLALLFVEHNKAPDLVPAGHGLIGCDWSANSSARWFEQADEAIVARTLKTIEKVFPELAGQVDFTHVTRWRHALPCTKTGAYGLIAAFNAGLDPASRIQFAGDYMSGAGQNTAVEFGNRAAAALLNQHRLIH